MKNKSVRKSYIKSLLFMDTVVSIKIVSARAKAEIDKSMARAFAAFYHMESVCSRFNNQTEISRLSTQIGIHVPVSPILFKAIQFACEVAAFTKGAFDPTLGNTLGLYGFNRDYLTGYQSGSTTSNHNCPVSYLDLDLNEEEQTILLRKPLTLDLGAIAKRCQLIWQSKN